MSNELKEEAKALPQKLADFSTVKRWLTKSSDTIEAMLSKRIPAEMFLKAILSEFRRNPDLHLCPSMTVLGGIFEMAQLGLMPGAVLGVAFLIPFKEHGDPRCVLVIGYKGFTVLARRENAHLDGVIIREGDEFDLDFGRPVPLIHKPALDIDRRDHKKIVGAYAKLLHPDGYMQVEPMGMSDLKAIRQNAPSNRNTRSAWHTATIQMYEKCPVRRLGTKSAFGSIVRAAALDEAGDTYGMAQALELTAAEVMEIDQIPPEQMSKPRSQELPPEPAEPQPQQDRPRRTRESRANRREQRAPAPQPGPQPVVQQQPVQKPPDPKPQKPADTGPRIDAERLNGLQFKAKATGVSRPAYLAWIKHKFGKDAIGNLSITEADEFDAWLTRRSGKDT